MRVHTRPLGEDLRPSLANDTLRCPDTFGPPREFNFVSNIALPIPRRSLQPTVAIVDANLRQPEVIIHDLGNRDDMVIHNPVDRNNVHNLGNRINDDPGPPLHPLSAPLPIRSANLFGAARQPYQEPCMRHDLGRMDIVCGFCGALHWKDEKLTKSSLRNPKFGICCAEGKFSKAIPPAIIPSPDVPSHEYQFMGDIHEITFICSASACEDPDEIYAHAREPSEVCPTPKPLPINHAKPPYVTVGGLAVNIDMAASTFELEISLYLSAIRDKPSFNASTPIRCVFDNSPRWNNHKPMPYNTRQGFVVVTGNLTGFILSKADASGHQSIERFIVTIRDVYFMGVVPPKKNQPSSNHALPNTLDSPGSSKRGKGLLFGGSSRQCASGSKSQTVTPTASPLIGATSSFISPQIGSSSKRPRVD